ncbi:Uncharacterised protein [Serratia marcescens]|nr:Uncharacterised protein [Serratia marcescens]
MENVAITENTTSTLTLIANCLTTSISAHLIPQSS